jgi:hypothetical protein
MPEIYRSATLSIEQGINLPMSPPLVIVGRGKDGKAVCQLYMSATGMTIAGPRGAEIRSFYWEDLVKFVQG